MKNTNKILLAAAFMLQLSGTLCADAWTDAYQLFGGVAKVKAGKGSLPWTRAKSIADQLKTPQAYAVGIYMSDYNPKILDPRFPGAAAQEELENLLASYDQLGQPVRSQVTANNSAPASAGYASNLNDKSNESSDLAVKAAQEANILAMSVQSEELQKLAVSNKEGVELYNSYVDQIFNVLQQATNAVLDPKDAQNFVQYIQKSAAKLSVPKQNSNVLGKMSSSGKKSHKNKKNK